MKNKFNKSWKASKQPRKQRKYLANAPLHLRKKLVSANLSKELRKKYGKRNIPIKKGDKVRIMIGKFKKKTGKVLEVKLKSGKIYIEEMQVKKQEGSKVNVPFKSSNLQIIELNMEGKKRIKNVEASASEERKVINKIKTDTACKKITESEQVRERKAKLSTSGVGSKGEVNKENKK